MGVFDVETGQGAARGDRQQLHLLEGRYGDEVPSVFAPWDRTAGAVGAADTSNPPSASSGWAGFPNTVEWFRTLYEWGLAAFHEVSDQGSREEQLYKRPPANMVGDDHEPTATALAAIPEYLQGFLFGRQTQTFTTDTSTNPDTTEDRWIPRTKEEWAVSIADAVVEGAGSLGLTLYRLIFGEDPDDVSNPFPTTVQNAFDEILEIGADALGTVDAVFAGARRTAQKFWRDAKDAIVDAIGQFTSGIWHTITTTADAIWASIKAIGHTAWSTIENIGNTIWSAIDTIGDTIWGIIDDINDHAWNVIKVIFPNPSSDWTAEQFFTHWIRTIWERLHTITGAGLEQLGNGITDFGQYIWRSVGPGDSNDILISGQTGTTTGNLLDTLYAIVIGSKNTGRTKSGDSTVRYFRARTWQEFVGEEITGRLGAGYTALVGSARDFMRWIWRGVRRGGDANDVIIRGTTGTTQTTNPWDYLWAAATGQEHVSTGANNVGYYRTKSWAELITDAFSWWGNVTDALSAGVTGAARWLWRGLQHNELGNPDGNDVMVSNAPLPTAPSNTVWTPVEEGAWAYFWSGIFGQDYSGWYRASPTGTLRKGAERSTRTAVNYYKPRNLGQAIAEKAADAADYLIAQIFNVTETIATAGKVAVTELIKAYNNVADSVTDVATRAGQAVTDVAVGTATAAGNFLGDVFDNVSAHVASGAEAFASWFIDAWNKASGQDPIIPKAAAEIEDGAPPVILHADTTTSSATERTRGTQGDIDMGTYDLRDVDRIFFNSNDPIRETDTRPQITATPSGQTSHTSLEFFVPSGGLYQFKTRTSRGVTETLGYMGTDDIQLYKDLIVGGPADTPTHKTLTVGNVLSATSGGTRTQTPRLGFFGVTPATRNPSMSALSTSTTNLRIIVGRINAVTQVLRRYGLIPT